jgi:Protein of unknown function (DUF4197)
MKTWILLASILLSMPSLGQHLKDLKNKAEKKLNENHSESAYSQDEAAQALKDALRIGAEKGSQLVNKTDGYFGNPKIKIPLPPDAQQKEQKLRAMGLNKDVDDAILSINRAAEDAGAKAKDIFVKAIQNMTISDAITIVKGNENAGTEYLKKQTTSALQAEFKPVIQASLDKVGATQHYGKIVTAYNKIPGVQKLNPDLADYVTQKAIEGLFVMVQEEEAKIRKDPAARATEILKKVFGKG